MIWDYALAILLAIGMVIGGLMALTLIYVVITEWFWWYKKWQTARYEVE